MYFIRKRRLYEIKDDPINIIIDAMLFRDTQPIELQKKHYSDFEYMLIIVILPKFVFYLIQLQTYTTSM